MLSGIIPKYVYIMPQFDQISFFGQGKTKEPGNRMFDNVDNILFNLNLFAGLQRNPHQKRNSEREQRRGQQIEETCKRSDDEEKQTDVLIDFSIVVA